MEKGVCTVSVAPLRLEPSHRSEMTSQLLYGETFSVLEREGNFYRIRQDWDDYEGWVSSYQFQPKAAEEIVQDKTAVLKSTIFQHKTSSGELLLSAGSEVEFEVREVLKNETFAETAIRFLNVPYLWSGRSAFGLDCSGFVQLVCKLHGVRLPREAAAQAQIGDPLSFLEEGRPGDLVFFENEEAEISHVGMLLEDQRIIHAFGKVRIDFLDSSGIFNAELSRHTHRLRFLRSLPAY